MFEEWESCKAIYSFKGHSGNCGECIAEVRVETDSGLRKRNQNLHKR